MRRSLRLVDSYYDLLASEARQAGFLAVVRGEIPEANWYRMGRSNGARRKRTRACVMDRDDV